MNLSARLKAAIFVATVTRRKPEPMPVDEAIVTPPKEAPPVVKLPDDKSALDLLR